MHDCIFCKIISGNAPAHIIHQDEWVICFLSLENHPLVVPKRHIADIYALDKENGERIMAAIIKMAKAVKKGLACDGIYITQANEPAAGQDVFHIHFHIYPRWHDRTIDETTMPKEEIVVKIKAALPQSDSESRPASQAH